MNEQHCVCMRVHARTGTLKLMKSRKPTEGYYLCYFHSFSTVQHISCSNAQDFCLPLYTNPS